MRRVWFFRLGLLFEASFDLIYAFIQKRVAPMVSVSAFSLLDTRTQGIITGFSSIRAQVNRISYLFWSMSIVMPPCVANPPSRDTQMYNGGTLDRSFTHRRLASPLPSDSCIPSYGWFDTLLFHILHAFLSSSYSSAHSGIHDSRLFCPPVQMAATVSSSLWSCRSYCACVETPPAAAASSLP